MKARHGALIGATVLMLAALVWWWQRAPEAPSVQVVSGPIARHLQFSARVTAQSSVEVGATITGRVEAVAVREGDEIKAGDVLVRLEDAEARAAWAQAQAGLQQAQAAVAGAQGTRRQAADAAVAQARAQQITAQAERQRTADLVARGFLSPSRGDEAERALAVADAQLSAAQAQQAALADAGSERAQAGAQLAAAQAALAAAQARLTQTLIRAPADARVLQRLAEPGQIVQPGRALLRLALSGPVELLAQVDERYLHELQPGQPATAVADAYAQQPFAARLSRMAPRVDAQRGAIELRFAPVSPPDFLREDMTLTLAVETARRDRAQVVPLAALRADNMVWTVREGRVQAVRVTTGLRSDTAVEVLEGLAEGDWVLLGSSPTPGQRARPVKAEAGVGTAALKGPGGEAGAAMTQAMGR
jgi:HlyD family secretion protein